jgi:hypothetical protein
MNSQIISNEPNILTLDTWQFHIDKKKLEFLTHIASSNYLENTSENLQFISIIKELVNCNLFNISKLAFYVLKLLEHTFIDSTIICEVISDDISKKITTTNITANTITKHTIESNEYLDTLKKYLHLIIDNIVYIELSLNIHFIIIINNLQKLQKPNIENLNNLTPKSFHTFENINNDIINTIKPSSHILLFLKLIRKLGNFHMISLNNNGITQNKDNKYTNYIKNNKESSNKIKCTLDSFIININNFYDSKDYKDMIIKCSLDTSLNITHSVNNTITSICQNYITFIVKVLFTEFNNLFDLLATHLKSSKNITEEKLKNIILIKTKLSNMINIEIDKIKNKLLFDK